jgi:hypothetical protein
MTSEKQIDANRRNAQQSTGPKTQDGRNRSRVNALRHGLTGQVTTMTDEDRAAHDKLSKALIASLAPEGAMETQLAQRIATDSWRGHIDEMASPYPRDLLAKSSTGGRRAAAIEDNLFALGLHEHSGKFSADPEQPGYAQIDAAFTTARVFTLESKQPQLLTLYEQRINRSIQKNLAMLQSLQAVRKAEHEAAMKEAAALLKLSEMSDVEYAPANDGFPFSTVQIHAVIDRQQRLKRASRTDFSKFKPGKFHTQAA